MPVSSVVVDRASALGLASDGAVIEEVRVLDVLVGTSVTEPSARVLGALVAHALALDPPVDAADAARKLIRMATYSRVDVFGVLDAAMGQGASSLWDAVALMIRQFDSDGTGLTRPEAIVAAYALATSVSATAIGSRNHLATTCQSQTLDRVFGGVFPDDSDADVLEGELARAPRGRAATFFLGLTGWLLVSHLVRIVMRLALHYRRPAEIRISRQVVYIRTRTRMLGKTLRETDSVIPIAKLARVTRDVRYPRLGTYAGLLSLVIGSYVGVGWFLNGVKSASFSIATVGLLIVLLGVGLDLVLMSLIPARKGRGRVLFAPEKGAVTCLGGVDLEKADSLLGKIAKRY